MARIAITESALLQALRDAGGDGVVERPADAFTAAELSAALGLGPSATRARIHALVQAGTVERIRIRVLSSQGSTVVVPAYRYIAERAA